MAVSLLASNGYRIAKSWQYEDNFPEPPSVPPPQPETASSSSEVGGGGGDGLLKQCVSGRKESLEARRPLIDGSPQRPAKISGSIMDEDDGYVAEAALAPNLISVC